MNMSHAKTPRAVLWDFGGVILSSPFEAFNRYEAETGLPKDFIRGLNARNADTNAWAKMERSEVSLEGFVAGIAPLVVVDPAQDPDVHDVPARHRHPAHRIVEGHAGHERHVRLEEVVRGNGLSGGRASHTQQAGDGGGRDLKAHWSRYGYHANRPAA